MDDIEWRDAMRQTEPRRVLGEAAIVGEIEEASDSVVKSAGRVFQILELLDVLDREALVCEISDVLGVPQSKTAVLLRSMVDLGYLSYNPELRAFWPTTRVALLGHSVGRALASDGFLLRLVERLNVRSGQLVAISCRSRTSFQYIHVLQARVAGRCFIVNGSKTPLTSSASGLVLLAQLPDAEIKKIALRINVDSTARHHVNSLSALMDQISEVRRKGYACSRHADTKTGMIAMKLTDIPGAEALAIGIGASNRRLQSHEEEYVAMMREEIAHSASLALRASPRTDAYGRFGVKSALAH